MIKKSIIKYIRLSFLLIPCYLVAQLDSIQQPFEKDSVDYEKELTSKKVYYLNNISIEGIEKYTPNQIMRFTGLEKGQKIELPGGSSISYAIKKLWRTKLFSDVSFYVDKIDGNKIDLTVGLKGLKELNKVNSEGISKGKIETFMEEINLSKTDKLTQNALSMIRAKIVTFFRGKGYPDTKVTFKETLIEDEKDKVDLKVIVDKGNRVKIKSITFHDNKEISDKKLKSKAGLKETKKKYRLLGILKPSKYIRDNYKEDLKRVEELYASRGFRDAAVVKENVDRIDDKNYKIDIFIDEGKKYYLGDIEFTGNSAFSTEKLKRILSYKKGDPYDAIGLNMKVQGSERDNDIHTLYLDNGYLFSNINVFEKSIIADTINLEVRVTEGLPAIINKVSFSGNNQTHDHVIVRSLMTRPGELFSKTDLKNTYFRLLQSGLYDQQGTIYDIKPNQETNTVDIDWKLVEKGSSQIELQGGFGNGRLVGTLGLTLNNFSAKNMFKKDAWRPIPMGDGQQLSLRLQAGNNFSSYNLSFTEPWLGGKTPTSLSTSIFNSRLTQDTFSGRGSLNILGASVGIVRRLNWPDNFFRLSHTISYQNYTYDNYPLNIGSLSLNDGFSNNLSYSISFSRRSAGPDPIFPTSGSDFEIRAKTTAPYSLFNDIDYSLQTAEEKVKWLEFYKLTFNGSWYKTIVGKLVLKAAGDFGYLGAFNSDRGISPFERFFVGGTGLGGNRFDGREIIPLRGYQDASNTGGLSGRDITPVGGGTIYNKFMLELRYPIVNGQTKVWGLAFAEGGNTYLDHKDFDPFNLRRSAGIGIRVFMAAFGIIGFDYGYGFDSALQQSEPSGWQPHFIIGQQF